MNHQYSWAAAYLLLKMSKGQSALLDLLQSKNEPSIKAEFSNSVVFQKGKGS
jgi:hypothetical protein